MPTPLSLRRKRLKENQPAHVVVSARAGSGKTTTLVEGLKIIQGKSPSIKPSPQQEAVWEQLELSKGARSICFAAFNASIAKELAARVPAGVDAKTMHSLGFGAVRKRFQLLPRDAVNGDKTFEILERLTTKPWRELDPVLAQGVNKLVGLCKVTLRDGCPEDLDHLSSYYDVECNGQRDRIYDLVPQVLDVAKNQVEDYGFIDFNDMIWLPIVHNLPLWRNDLLLVDESQDLNPCQQELALKMGKRLVLCGDPFQAIYGFAGADATAMTHMTNRLGNMPQGCVELKLTVTRRCGKKIVEAANAIVPDLEAHPDAPEGKVTRAFLTGKDVPAFPIGPDSDDGTYLPGHNPEEWNYRGLVQDRDMILCRVNAPLVSECFKFIKEGRKANIQGRNIGQGLINMIKRFNAKDLTGLVGKLSNWYEREVAKEQAKKFPSEAKLIALADKRDCIDCFVEQCDSVESLIAKIDSIFTDSNTGGIMLSSIHKAKGLEALNVFILDIVPFPHPMAKTKEAQEQEKNLRYVGLTRAISCLCLVTDR